MAEEEWENHRFPPVAYLHQKAIMVFQAFGIKKTGSQVFCLYVYEEAVYCACSEQALGNIFPKAETEIK